MGFTYLNLTLVHKCRRKALKVCYVVSLSKNFQRQCCSAINCLSNGISIFSGDDPVLGKYGPRGTDSQQEGCEFHVSHAERCVIGVSRPSCRSNGQMLHRVMMTEATLSLYTSSSGMAERSRKLDQRFQMGGQFEAIID